MFRLLVSHLVSIYFPDQIQLLHGALLSIACVFTPLPLGVAITSFNEFLLSFVSFAHST